MSRLAAALLCVIALTGLLGLREARRPVVVQEPPPHLRRGTLNLSGCRLAGHAYDPEDVGRVYMRLTCDRGVVVLIPSGPPPRREGV